MVGNLAYQPILFFLLRGGRFEADLFQDFGFRRKLGIAGGELIHAQNVGENIGVLFAADMTWPVSGHGCTDAFKQVTDCQAEPV